MASRAHRELLPKELRRRRRKLFVWKIIACTFGILVCVAGVILILRMDSLRINDIYIEGKTQTLHEKIREASFKAIDGARFMVVPKNSTLIFSKEAIEAAIRTVAPESDTVDIQRSGIRSLTVVITERAPTGLWCGGELKAFVSTTPCYFIDKEAVIFSRAFPADPRLRIGSSTMPLFGFPLRDRSRSPLGSVLVSPSAYAVLTALASDLATQSVYVRSFAFSGEDIELVLDDDLRVLLPRGEAMYDAARNLMLVLSSEDFMQGEDVEYIDLRFGNKVFYKEK